MTIAGLQDRSKLLLGRIPADVLILLVLVLSASAAFGLGYLAGRDAKGGEGKGVWVETLTPASAGPASGEAAAKPAPPSAPAKAAVPAATSDTDLVASKNGTKYYLSTCSGVKRIKEENRIYFKTKAEAEAEGYTPAANCPGL